MFSRRTFSILLSMSALSATVGVAGAQEFPSRNIAIVVHTGPGGPFDTLARRMAELLNKDLGWRVRVENREGSTGVIALNSVMREPADGHTIIAIGNHTANNIALSRTEYTLDDLEYIGALNGEPSALVVPASSPYTTLEGYVSKLRAEPDSIRVGGSGTASNAFAHFLLNEAAGITSTWIPFDTAPEAITTLLGGHLDAAFLTPSSALAQITSREFRVLALSSDERSSLHPDIPTFSEQGYDVDLFLWRGFGLRAGTPAEVVEAWRAAFRQIQADPAWAEMMTAQQQEAFTLQGDALKDVTRREIDGFARYDEATGKIQ
jgi:putative tricarboxylic transport membrane protein